MSSTFVIGRLLLVILRKPSSQYARPTIPLDSSFWCIVLPNGPSTTVSASFAFANMNGKS